MKKISLILLIGMIQLSCSDFFDKEPYNTLSSETFYDSEKALVLHSNGLIIKNMPGVGTLCWGDQYSDIMAVNSTQDFLKTATWSAQQQTGWARSNWAQIYNVNYYLSRMYEAAGAVNNDAIMKHYEGVGRFWRAWLYYDKVRTFGGVPWYDKPIDPEDKEQLYKGRDSREYVMDKILEDLNFAAEHCFTDSKYLNNSLINKYVVLALKSRICLFEGTYRKYHTEMGLSGSAERWLRECISASQELMNNSPYSILNSPTNVQTQYRSLFNSPEPQYQEVIYANEFNADKARFHNVTWKFTSGSFGSRWSPTKAFVNTYLNLDGSRFTDKDDYNKTDFYTEMQNRDYRLQQSIMSPWYTKKVAGKDQNVTQDFSVTLTGYQVIKWNLDDETYEGVEISANSLPVFRMGEILLNYAEAKAELGEMNSSVWDESIRPLRERSGVNGAEPIDTDDYLKNYYRIDDKWILEIRRERAIELLLEGHRYNDLMRWKLADLLLIEWDGIYIPKLDTPIDLNNDGKNDFCVVKEKSGTESGVYYLNLSTMPNFELNSDNCLVYKESRVWEDKKYLRPIPKSAIDVNPNLEQNPGWEETSNND